MLETPQERVKLLRAGIFGKDIEKLYLIYNDFKIVGNSILFQRLNLRENKNNIDNSSISSEASAEYGCG